MAQYKYAPLNSGKEIRLLHLLPGQTSDDIEIEIFVAEFQSEKRPQYEALSYAWGSTNDRRIIKICHGSRGKGRDSLRLARKLLFHQNKASTLAVTQNLEIALRHLRLPDRRRVLWIDAICINQSNLAERSAEVSRMGLIFSSARQVVVWLGPESEDSALAVETLRRIGQDVDHDENIHTLYIKPGTETELLEDDAQALEAKETNWIAVKNLLQRDWFQRLWVIQETKLAAQVVINVGSRNIPWRMFGCALLLVWNDVSPYTSTFVGIDLPRLGFRVRGKELSAAVDILDSTRESLCSDPRDRVYAILSLLDENISQGIVPNYILSPEDVYKDFTLHCIKKLSNLDILRLCTRRGQLLTSWVPNLSIPCPTVPFLWCYASGNSTHEFCDSMNGSLNIRGVHASSINHVTNGAPHGAKLPETLSLCSDWEPEDVVSAPYKHGGTMLDAYLTTLVGGLTYELMPSNSGSAPSIQSCRSFFFNCIRGRESEGLSRGELEYVGKMLSNLPGRAFFTTADGYIEICPADARCDDYICVILGSEVPLVLRPLSSHNGQYQLVGECYVHGLMFAEGLLGPIPRSWERHSVRARGQVDTIWKHGDNKTHDDPRLGPLPADWRRIYFDGDKVQDKPFDRDGNPHPTYFEQDSTGIRTWDDPRLKPEALVAKGVDIKEFILV
jgi:hypothetical protein